MEPYYSLSRQETTLLKRTRGEDCRIYLALRERADFKSGRLDHPSARNLTSASLARELSLPASQGMPALILERKDISRGFSRLQALGLVDELERKGHAIRLRLPLVAQSTFNAEPKKNRLSQMEGRTTARLPQIPNDAASTGRHEEWTSSQSGAINVTPTLTRTGEKMAPKLPQLASPQPVETAAGAGFEVNRASALNTKNLNTNTPSMTPMTTGEDTSPSARKDQTHHAPKALTEEIEKSDRYRAVVERAGQGRLLWTRSPISRAIYRGWEAMGVHEADVRDAVLELLGNPDRRPTPNGVDAVIRARRMPPHQVKTHAGRGKGDLVL